MPFPCLLSGRGLQLQLDDERELLRAALCHLEAELLEGAHLRKRAGEAARQRASGRRALLPVCLPAWRAAHRAVVEAERGTVRVEQLLQLALRDAQLTLTRLEGLCAREQLGLRL